VHLLAFLDKDSKKFDAESKAVKEVGTKLRTKVLTIYMPKTEDRILGVSSSSSSSGSGGRWRWEQLPVALPPRHCDNNGFATKMAIYLLPPGV